MQHAWMALLVVAAPERLRDWLARAAAPAAEPATPDMARGHDAFLAHGCGACHAIRGTAALGTLGPDLTHVGGRFRCGGPLRNHAGHWPRGSPSPSTSSRATGCRRSASGRDKMGAIAAYLESLK